MIFFSNYTNRPVYGGEKLDDTLLVERSGYVSAQKRIQSLMMAGERLQASRSEAYDFQEGLDDGSIPNPLNRRGYDLADATADLAALKKLKEAFPIETPPVSDVPGTPVSPETPPVKPVE